MKSRIPQSEVAKAARHVISKKQPFWRDFWGDHVPRVCEEISWIFTPGGTVVDLGGATGFHASICAVLGMRAICVDSLRLRPKGHTDDHFYEQDIESEEEVSRGLGVEFIHTDLLTWEPPFPPKSIDVCMSFDNIEHLHHSPQGTYRRVSGCLKEGGLFLIGAPNAANLLKRIQVPLGINIFSDFDGWYGHETFIGHVREPVIADYLRIARDLGLEVEGVAGRNWLGYYGGKKKKAVTSVIDRPLRLFPPLCSDIYLLARKPPIR